MNNMFKLRQDMQDLIHLNIIKNDTLYPLVFTGYLIKKYNIDLNGKFEDMISFISYIKTTIDELSYSKDEKQLLDESLNEILSSCMQSDFKRIIITINKYTVDDYLSFITYPCNVNKTTVGTSNSLNELCIKLLDTKKNGSVLDMVCGNGDFLTSIVDKNINLKVTGYEMNINNLLYTRIRMYMLNANFDYDRLMISDKVNDIVKYDSIYCIPGFGMNVDLEEISFKNFECKKGNSYYWTYVDKAIDMLTNNGKAIFIFPKSPMFKIPDSNVREYLIKNKLVESIIELPENIFQNTNIGAVLMVLSRNNSLVKVLDATDMKLKNYTNNLDIDEIVYSLNNDTKYSKSIVGKEFESNFYSFIPSYYTKDVSKEMKNPVLLKNYIEVIRGYRGTIEREATEDTCKYLKLVDIVDNEVIKDNMSNIKYDQSLDKYLLEDKDVVITARGSRFECAIVRIDKDEKIVCGENFFILRVINPELNPFYLSAYFNSDKGKEAIFVNQIKTTILSIKSKGLLNTYIDLISNEIQKKIEDSEMKKTKLKESYRKELSKLNDSINKLLN